MKKLFTILLAVALMLSALSLAALNVAAEEEENETSFQYGNATVELTLIENFNSAEANTFYGWGQYSVVDNMFKMEVSGSLIWDAYSIKSGMLSAATTYSNVSNFVISIKENRSDGDIFFAFQPHSTTLATNDGNLFTGWVEGYEPLLVDETGKMTPAKRCPSVDLMSGRAGYIIPMGFEGYIVFPMKNLVIHGDWYTSYYSDLSAVDIDAVGFHVAVDDATYAELCIDDLFVCGELPAYEQPTVETKPVETLPETAPEAPVETDGATLPETLPETQPESVLETDPESASETKGEAETSADSVNDTATDTETEAESKSETTAETKSEEGGCASLVGGLCILPLMAVAAVALRRRED